MSYEQLLDRITVDPRGMRREALRARHPHLYRYRPEGLAEGLTPDEIMKEYPPLTLDEIHVALAYAAELSRENIWKLRAG